jgi:hypothetical protein
MKMLNWELIRLESARTTCELVVWSERVRGREAYCSS